MLSRTQPGESSIKPWLNRSYIPKAYFVIEVKRRGGFDTIPVRKAAQYPWAKALALFAHMFAHGGLEKPALFESCSIN